MTKLELNGSFVMPKKMVYCMTTSSVAILGIRGEDMCVHDEKTCNWTACEYDLLRIQQETHLLLLRLDHSLYNLRLLNQECP